MFLFLLGLRQKRLVYLFPNNLVVNIIDMNCVLFYQHCCHEFENRTFKNYENLENIRRRDVLLHQFKKENNSGTYEQVCRIRNQN